MKQYYYLYPLLIVVAFSKTTVVYSVEIFSIFQSSINYSATGYRYTDGRRAKLVGESILTNAKALELSSWPELDTKKFIDSLFTSDFYVHPKDSTIELRHFTDNIFSRQNQQFPKKVYIHEVSNHPVSVDSFDYKENIFLLQGSIYEKPANSLTVTLEYSENRDISDKFSKISLKLYSGKLSREEVNKATPVLVYEGLRSPVAEPWIIFDEKYNLGKTILKLSSILCAGYSARYSDHTPGIPIYFLVLAYII